MILDKSCVLSKFLSLLRTETVIYYYDESSEKRNLSRQKGPEKVSDTNFFEAICLFKFLIF